MELAFEKMHGLGNDFAVIEDWDSEIELSQEQIQMLCDRHFGIGADGLIFVRSSKEADCCAFMHYINSDGSLAQMCGNGVRCFAKYLVDHGFVPCDADEVNVETRAGIRQIRFETDDQGKLVTATVNMGAPILEPQEVPTTCSANAQMQDGTSYAKEVPLDSPWGDFKFTMVSMGNPHAICFVESWDELPDDVFNDPQNKSLDTFSLEKVGSHYEKHSAFPEKCNIEFVDKQDDVLAVRVWERGCGETLACGTGACAVSVAATLTQRSGDTNTVALPGGKLTIQWSSEGSVFMTGAAQTVYKGTITV